MQCQPYLVFRPTSPNVTFKKNARKYRKKLPPPQHHKLSMQLLFVLMALVAPSALASPTCTTSSSNTLIRCATLDPNMKLEDRSQVVQIQANFMQECTQQCVYRNNVLNNSCVGFIYRRNDDPEVEKRKTCMFFPCVTDAVKTVTSATSVVLSANCFVTAGPSEAPTSSAPSHSPTTWYTSTPTTLQPSLRPTAEPTVKVTKQPTPEPTKRPTATPTAKPTKKPTTYPTPKPSREPTYGQPSAEPTIGTPSASPTSYPSFHPTERQPSASPTAYPTEQPTEATSAPTKPPTLAPSLRATSSPDPNVFVSPTDIQDWAPLDLSWVGDRLIPDVNTCMIVRPSLGTNSITYENFIGTRNHCFKECQYTPGCNGIIYSDVLNVCTLATTLETTDEPTESADFAKYWVVFPRVGVSVRHYNNFCALWMAEGTCNTDDPLRQCRWNTGTMGYNQFRFTDMGYCGRVKCVVK